MRLANATDPGVRRKLLRDIRLLIEEAECIIQVDE